MKKYYDVLQLPVGASSTEIKKAYFKLAKLYHPDVNSSADASKKFKEINEAYEFLSDPQKVRNLLYKYTTTKNQKQKRDVKRSESIKRKTTKRASVKKREFERIVNKDTLIKDFKKVGKTMLFFHLTINLFVVFGYLSDSKDKYSISDLPTIFLEVTFTIVVIGSIFLLMIYADYISHKNS